MKQGKRHEEVVAWEEHKRKARSSRVTSPYPTLKTGGQRREYSINFFIGPHLFSDFSTLVLQIPPTGTERWMYRRCRVRLTHAINR